MKRTSKNHDNSSFIDDDANNSLELEGHARNNEAGWLNMIGCGGGGDGDNLTANIVVSVAASITNEPNEANSADIFLNQTAYDGSGRGCRNNIIAKKSKRKSLIGGSADDKSKNCHNQHDLSSLIASELTKLSIEDRVKALEEVHGVVEKIEEDPKEINKLFDQVKEELKRIRYKQAYEKAAFLSSAYVNDPEFVLPFLRADNYNPRPTAIRLAEHFKYKLELFGEHTLVRDIMYDDLSDNEKTILNSGFVQTLPIFDRAGRQIVVCNMSELFKVGNLTNVIRTIWYLSIRNAQMNAAISKNGIVGVYFAHGMGNIFEKLYRDESTNGMPFKIASIHFCYDDTFGSAMQTYVMMTLGKYARIRLRSHCGSLLECRYALKSFGVDIDTFETGGSTSLSDSVQGVIQRCRELDESQRKKLNARLLPRPNDVLLGRGRPFQLYSGNLALTTIIDGYRAQYMSSKKMIKKTITSEIVESIRASGGRFLKKGSDVDWEEVDFETSRLKVSHSFRTISKWHSDNDDAWNHGGKGSEQVLVDSIPSILGKDTNSLCLTTEATPSNTDPLTTNVNFASSNKRRKG